MPKYKSPLLQALHEDMVDFYESGFIENSVMEEFNRNCLQQTAIISPTEIRQIREKTHLEPQYFANRLNISKRTLLNWEKGISKPSGSALKLLNIVKNKGIEAID